MAPEAENMITLQEASKMTPYSADYLSLLVRKGKLEGKKENGKWFTTDEAVERYMQKIAEASYAHQESLNVKVPAAEIKKASLSLKWAAAMMAVLVAAAVAGIIFFTAAKKNTTGSKYQIVEDKDHNITIFVDDPSKIGKVTVMPKE